MGCCSSSKQTKSQQERDKILREGSQVIVQMQKQIKEMLEQNILYEKQITEMKNQLKQLTVLLDEKSTKLTTQTSAMDKYQISDKDEIAEVQREIRELKQQTEFYEQKQSKNEQSLQQVQMQLQNVAHKLGGGVNQQQGSKQLNELLIQGDQQQLKQRIYNNERNLQVQEEEFNKKVDNINSQMNKMQTANTINKRDIDNLLEIVQTQQQLIIDEVQKHKQTTTQLNQMEQQLIISKEFQLIQQLQIEKISNMLMELRNQSNPNKSKPTENYGTQLQECIEQQKRRHLNDLNIIHMQQGFQWEDWRELEEYKWVLTPDNKFAHEFEIKQLPSAAATTSIDQNSMKQKVVCNICYLQYISMNKFFTQIQLNQLAQQ